MPASVCYKGIYTPANKHVTRKQKGRKNTSFPLVHDGLFFLNFKACCMTEQGIYLFHKISFLSNDFKVLIMKSMPLFPPQSHEVLLRNAKDLSSSVVLVMEF